MDKRFDWLVPVILVLAIAATEMAVDMYIPSLPLLSHYFHVEEEIVALTLSGHLFALFISGTIYGPLSDRLGRRFTLILGMTIFTFGAFLGGMAPTMEFLIGARFIQGLGGSVSWIVGIAMVKDLYQEERCSRILSTMYMVIAFAPGIAPIIGTQVVATSGWRATFFVVSALALIVTLVMAVALKETLLPEKRMKLSLKMLFLNYCTIIKNPLFSGYAMISALLYAGWWGYISAIPYILMDVLKVELIHFGYYQMALVFAFIIGSNLNRFCVTKVGVNIVLIYGLIICTIGSILFLLYAFMAVADPFYITALMGIYSIGMGLVFANTATRALDVFPDLRGAASAMMGGFESLIPAVTVSVVSNFFDDTVLPIAWVQLICSVVCVLIISILVIKESSLNTLQNHFKKAA
ncbi:MAG: multidrug effflux MFS transporter [Candidatus Paracaedimonas acanthamoebae]|uniref:Bcr/CflA family efflux transporter n=1 Tax=Candidatus Paracaedimonas acanthamoebae TaxID=244581 RepID=A0A8J7PRU4_9PROT|nr:multidrug effflux MFS transporter [Candidatus Paracaedimonas acanthamoebae]